MAAGVGSAANAGMKAMTGTTASAGYAVKSATKSITGKGVNARYAIKPATKGMTGRGVSVNDAGNMPRTRYMSGSSVSTALLILPV
jgi:hypothetical protein